MGKDAQARLPINILVHWPKSAGIPAWNHPYAVERLCRGCYTEEICLSCPTAPHAMLHVKVLGTGQELPSSPALALALSPVGYCTWMKSILSMAGWSDAEELTAWSSRRMMRLYSICDITPFTCTLGFSIERMLFEALAQQYQLFAQ